jgi:hypothetical protein
MPSRKPMVQDGFEYREMNDAEFAQYEIDQVKAGEQVEKDLEKASAKASAESKLKALGLTDAEVSALIG